MEFPWHSGKVLEQLNRQRRQGMLCDCTFVVDGVDFKAHKAVLAACSVYFRTLFLDQTDVVHLDISNAAGGSSLCILYTCTSFFYTAHGVTVLYINNSSCTTSLLLSDPACCIVGYRCRFGAGLGVHVHSQADFKSTERGRRACSC